MDFVKTYLEKYLFKHDNNGHKNLTWGSLVDEQGSEETENPAEHPWNLAVSSVQPKTSSVPDKKHNPCEKWISCGKSSCCFLHTLRMQWLHP